MTKSIQQKDIKNLIKHLETFNNNTEEDEIEELTAIVSFIMDLGAGLTDKLKYYFEDDTPLNVEMLNYLIDSIDTKKMKVIYSSGILRYTYSYKKEIKNWQKLQDKLYQECLEKNLDTEDIFYGLKN